MAKIGSGHAEAMLRLGLKELRNALNPSKESVADTEIGLYGTKTQGEIANDRGGPGSGPEQETGKEVSPEVAQAMSRDGQEQQQSRGR